MGAFFSRCSPNQKTERSGMPDSPSMVTPTCRQVALFGGCCGVLVVAVFDLFADTAAYDDRHLFGSIVK